MYVTCLDMEGVLVPEIWIAFAEASGIPELKRTTRDEPDYDKLMNWRLGILREHGLGLKEIQETIATIDPLPGAKEFLDELRDCGQVIVISDTFTQFAKPLMEKLGMEPQVALTLPLLEGTDGVQKMSKSYGNYIGLTDEPNDMFGKVMSIPDELMVKYYRLASTVSVSEIDEIERGLAADELHPNKVKRSLARNIVAAYYDEDAASAAEADFDLKFKEHGFPEDAPTFEADLTPNDEGKVYFAKLLVDAGTAQTVSEARRLIDGGAVKVNGETLAAKQYNVDPSFVEGAEVQVGKKKFVRFI